MAVLTFKDWSPSFDSVRPGSPIEVTLGGFNSKRKFLGYVHHIKPEVSPGKSFVEITCIGGSFPMKQASQKVYRDYTADQVIKDIAIRHNLNFIGEPHPREFEMISQAGYTDWQLAVRLAKQVGYTLRAENTDIYFEPILKDYERYRDSAPIFTLRDENAPEGSTLYSFQPLVGESIDYDGDMKAAVAVSGVDRFSKTAVKQTKQKRNKTTKSKRQDEFFDRFNSLVVAPTPAIAKYESDAAEARNSFPYRGTATVLGSTNLRPNMPVYLDGLGSTYSGYWTVLGTEHVMVETERNVFTYTTTISLGTDSLGSTNAWTDGAIIAAPSPKPKRTINRAAPQTIKKAGSKLKVKNIRTNNANKGSFGKIGNRKKETKKTKTPGSWATTKPVTRTTFVEKKIKSPTVANRVRQKAVR
jgi:phage protein D